MNSRELAFQLRQIPLFAELADSELDALAESASVREYEPGQIIASRNEKVRGFFLVLSGLVKLYKVSVEGKEQTIYLFGPGEPFCLCSFVSGGRFPADAAALEPSLILRLEADAFEKLTREKPNVLLAMLTVMSRRLKEAMDMIESLSLKEIPARIAAFMLHEAARQDGHGQGVVKLEISQRELSKIIGVTPEALSRALKRMRESGYIETRGREISLVDAKGLAECAEGLCQDNRPH
jgi:CRP/FNR family transcriptional regulator